jgi:hypothetical protein
MVRRYDENGWWKRRESWVEGFKISVSGVRVAARRREAATSGQKGFSVLALGSSYISALKLFSVCFF